MIKAGSTALLTVNVKKKKSDIFQMKQSIQVAFITRYSNTVQYSDSKVALRKAALEPKYCCIGTVQPLG